MTFEPTTFQARFLGGHVQTIYAWAKTRTFARLPAPVSRFFDVAPDARVLAHCHWHDRPADHPTLLLLHGLEGSSMAHYMGGMADKAKDMMSGNEDKIDDAVKDERTVNQLNAFTYCLDKSG